MNERIRHASVPIPVTTPIAATHEPIPKRRPMKVLYLFAIGAAVWILLWCFYLNFLSLEETDWDTLQSSHGQEVLSDFSLTSLPPQFGQKYPSASSPREEISRTPHHVEGASDQLSAEKSTAFRKTAAVIIPVRIAQFPFTLVGSLIKVDATALQLVHSAVQRQKKENLASADEDEEGSVVPDMNESHLVRITDVTVVVFEQFPSSLAEQALKRFSPPRDAKTKENRDQNTSVPTFKIRRYFPKESPQGKKPMCWGTMVNLGVFSAQDAEYVVVLQPSVVFAETFTLPSASKAERGKEMLREKATRPPAEIVAAKFLYQLTFPARAVTRTKTSSDSALSSTAARRAHLVGATALRRRMNQAVPPPSFQRGAYYAFEHWQPTDDSARNDDLLIPDKDWIVQHAGYRVHNTHIGEGFDLEAYRPKQIHYFVRRNADVPSIEARVVEYENPSLKLTTAIDAVGIEAFAVVRDSFLHLGGFNVDVPSVVDISFERMLAATERTNIALNETTGEWSSVEFQPNPVANDGLREGEETTGDAERKRWRRQHPYRTTRGALGEYALRRYMVYAEFPHFQRLAIAFKSLPKDITKGRKFSDVFKDFRARLKHLEEPLNRHKSPVVGDQGPFVYPSYDEFLVLNQTQSYLRSRVHASGLDDQGAALPSQEEMAKLFAEFTGAVDTSSTPTFPDEEDRIFDFSFRVAEAGFGLAVSGLATIVVPPNVEQVLSLLLTTVSSPKLTALRELAQHSANLEKNPSSTESIEVGQDHFTVLLHKSDTYERSGFQEENWFPYAEDLVEVFRHLRRTCGVAAIVRPTPSTSRSPSYWYENCDNYDSRNWKTHNGGLWSKSPRPAPTATGYWPPPVPFEMAINPIDDARIFFEPALSLFLTRKHLPMIIRRLAARIDTLGADRKTNSFDIKQNYSKWIPFMPFGKKLPPGVGDAQNQAILDPNAVVRVFWEFVCCSCCGFSQEIYDIMTSVDSYVDLRTFQGPECFCAPPHQAGDRMLQRAKCPFSAIFAPGPDDVVVYVEHYQPSYRSFAATRIGRVVREPTHGKEDFFIEWPRKPKKGGNYERRNYVDFIVHRVMHEFDQIPPTWVKYFNDANWTHEIWVPGNAIKEAFINSGVDPDRVAVVPEAINTADWDPSIHSKAPLPPHEKQYGEGPVWCNRYIDEETRNATGQRKIFNFIADFKWEWRKAGEHIVAAFEKAFDSTDPVALTIFTKLYEFSSSDTGTLGRHLTRILLGRNVAANHTPAWDPEFSSPGWPTMCFVLAHLTTEEMIESYNAADAFVSATRGEGWGLPLIQAMSLGLPTISPTFGGQSDFMDPDCSYHVNYSLVEVPPKLRSYEIVPGMRWAEVSIPHLAAQMTEVAINREKAKQIGVKARQHIVKNFGLRQLGKRIAFRLSEIRKKVFKYRTLLPDNP